jgi:hypothetical protein
MLYCIQPAYPRPPHTSPAAAPLRTRSAWLLVLTPHNGLDLLACRTLCFWVARPLLMNWCRTTLYAWNRPALLLWQTSSSWQQRLWATPQCWRPFSAANQSMACNLPASGIDSGIVRLPMSRYACLQTCLDHSILRGLACALHCANMLNRVCNVTGAFVHQSVPFQAASAAEAPGLCAHAHATSTSNCKRPGSCGSARTGVKWLQTEADESAH